jgi:hypothetical protein
MPIFSIWPWLAVLVIPGVAGAALLVLGLRGRRIDDHPVCRKCRFDLIGAPEPRTKCPECGADVASRVRIGNRRKRGGAIVVGALLLLIGLGLGGAGGYAAYTRSRPNALKPTWWLVMETRWDEAGCQSQLQELVKRQLSDAQAAELAARGLAIQGDTSKPWLVEWGEAVERRRVEGKLSDADWERYLVQGAQLEFFARPKVRRGAHVPVRMRLRGRVGRMLVSVRSDQAPLKLDGESRPQLRFGGFGGSASTDGSMTSGFTYEPERFGEPLTVGRHTCEVTLPLRLQGGSDPLTVKREQTFTCAFEVVGGPTVTPIRDESLRAAVIAATRVNLNWMSVFRGEQALGVNVNFDSPPAPLAHEVWLRAGGQEVRFGSATAERGKNHGTGTSGTPPPGEVVDVIFRPSAEVAERTEFLTEYWDGEFVIEGVKAPPKPAPKVAE